MKYSELLNKLNDLAAADPSILDQEVTVDCMDSRYGPSLFHKFSEFRYTTEKDNGPLGQLYLW